MSNKVSFFRKLTAIAVLCVGLFVAAFSFLSETELNFWWVRIWDFPRTAIATLSAILALIGLYALKGRVRPLFILLMLATMFYQGWRIWPYTLLAPTEVARIDIKEIGRGNCFKTMSFNVYQYTPRYEDTAELVGQVRPDILLLLETDRKWEKALRPLLSRYATVEAVPLDNTYGMIFATDLPVEKLRFDYLVEKDTPSLFAELTTYGGRRFRLLGLHPRPPTPGQDTEERDAEIAIAATIAARDGLPVLAMGDFNDVAWSKTSQLFKRIGRYLDPRIGRGFYATFPARLPIFKWPLDHYFFSEDFLLGDIELQRDVGSDHLPISSTLCLEPNVGEAVNDAPEPVTVEDRMDSVEAISEGLQEAQEKGTASQ